MSLVVGEWTIDILVQGFPGKSGHHGGLGWCTVALLRGQGRTALMDPGPLGVRRVVRQRLAELGIALEDVTDVLLSHSHWDHCVNWPLFGQAQVTIGAEEFEWALSEPVGDLIPEMYVRELRKLARIRLVKDGEEVLPNVTAHITSGHTPGHLTYVLREADHDVIFTGDAAKNRAELKSRTAASTYDPAISTKSIEQIWSWWRDRPGTILVPGHDIAMVENAGDIYYLERRAATIEAWYGDDLESTTVINLAVEGAVLNSEARQRGAKNVSSPQTTDRLAPD